MPVTEELAKQLLDLADELETAAHDGVVDIRLVISELRKRAAQK